MKRFPSPLALVAALSLAACSSQDAADPAAPDTGSTTAAIETGGATPASPASPAATSPTLALEGLGELVVGQPVPANSSFTERGAQISAECRAVSSPRFPGVYAITEGKGGPVRRITVGDPSEIALVEGIAVGASEKEVLAAFPGFVASPHKYVAAPGKDLTQPGDDPRLRFEIGEDGKVSLIHVGTMPQLGYVEGCA